MGTKKKTAGKYDPFSQEKAIDGDEPQGSPQIWGISNERFESSTVTMIKGLKENMLTITR